MLGIGLWQWQWVSESVDRSKVCIPQSSAVEQAMEAVSVSRRE